ncbi:amino acid adenylation domain-containing protein [Micromonospora sp. NPDC047557]|uniref:amino acid adenylation domain-containing protein n=1 Tax=Micromonospora sp. NPDC047557 TaxID=3364250 RepID=UPI0037239561
MTTVDRTEVLAPAGAAEVLFPGAERLMHELFHDRAGLDPDATAIVHPGGSMTYRELQRHADEVADGLLAAGLAPGEIVAVVVSKGWQQIAAALGVLGAGGVFVPIDPDFPAERIRRLLDHSQARAAVLAGDAAVPPIPATMTRVVVGDPPGPLRAGRPRVPVSPDDLAYIIYTSGSTGQPKGVMISHRGAVNTLLDINDRFGVGPGDRVFAVSSFTFDLSIYDYFGTLAAGATIVIPPRTPLPDPSVWLDLVVRHRVTVWNSVPALLRMLVELAESRGGGERMASLRLVLLSGDWIGVDLPDRLRALATGATVVSAGGATEASIWSIFYVVDRVDPGWRSIPYGKPLANQRFHVLDEQGLPCRPGVPGELYIGGIGVAQGYWRDPERTAAAFVVDDRLSDRLYRTGDMGRYLDDGNIEFLGRRDFQVKIQGFRVELGEVEATLRAHPGVRDAVAVARADQVGDRRLFAYTTTSDPTLSSEDLRAHLGTTLPGYMVPDAIGVLDRMPLTTSGKVDRSALPEIVVEVPAGVPAAPASAIEEVLVSVWEETLGQPGLGADSDFFAVGGNSLRALRLVAAVNAVFVVEVAVGTLFEAATPRAFAAVLAADPEIGDRVRRASEELVRAAGESPRGDE